MKTGGPKYTSKRSPVAFDTTSVQYQLSSRSSLIIDFVESSICEKVNCLEVVFEIGVASKCFCLWISS